MKNVILLIVAVGIIIFISFGNKTKEKDQTYVEDMENSIFDQNDNVLELEKDENLISPQLLNHIWVWDKTVMSNDDIIIPQKPKVFTLKFAKEKMVSGTTDCNNFFGPYNITEDHKITFGPLSSTLMFCEGSQESVFVSQISESNKFFFDEAGNLVLLLPFDSGSVIFKK